MQGPPSEERELPIMLPAMEPAMLEAWCAGALRVRGGDWARLPAWRVAWPGCGLCWRRRITMVPIMPIPWGAAAAATGGAAEEACCGTGAAARTGAAERAALVFWKRELAGGGGGGARAAGAAFFLPKPLPRAGLQVSTRGREGCGRGVAFAHCAGVAEVGRSPECRCARCSRGRRVWQGGDR
jgi:hypothetical protein